MLRHRLRKRFGQRFAQLRHVDLQGRIDGNQLFAQQIAVEATCAGQETRRGARLVGILNAPGKMIEDDFAPGTDQVNVALLQPAVEQRQITAVRIPGIVGQPFSSQSASRNRSISGWSMAAMFTQCMCR